MGTRTTAANGKPYYYYKCFRRSDYKRGICEQKSLRAERVEASVWEFVSSLLKDPERIRAGMDRLIEQERNSKRGDPEREAQAWAETIIKCVRLRNAYQDQQAAGLMTLEELGSKLKDLDEPACTQNVSSQPCRNHGPEWRSSKRIGTPYSSPSRAKYSGAWTASMVRSGIPSIEWFG
jgi:hypothetical protein